MNDNTTGPFTRRAALLAAAAAMAVAIPGQALADWPSGTLRVIVPYAPGGTSDNIPRAVVPALERILGTSIVIENISGGGGTIGTTRIAGARPDGATFGFVPTATLAIAPHMRDVAYDPLGDIQPVAKVAESYGAMAVRNDFPPQSLEDIIAYARENPGGVTFGSAGIGSITHLYVEIFADAAGIEVTHVPFQGSAEAMNNVMGGHIDGQFDAVVLRQAQAGAVRPVAILNEVRWQGLPDVPTMKELGFDGFDGIASWFGFIAPAGVPEEAVQGFSDAVAEALQDPEVLERLAALGVIPTYLDADAFGSQIQSNHATYGALLGNLGLTR
ncbi:MAG: tripartite tricarboxylate transporter substrate binding protein [Rhodobacteraceae bacterium]|nr:tripartite tricarboxylate transporter substrate binding protein [Paracoccaceae bacterium]